jgi:hypothetical protein
MVIVADIKADNGVVHVINAVMTPSPKVADAGQLANTSEAGVILSGQDCDN